MNYKRITEYDDTFGYKPMCEECERSEFDRCKPNECREVVLQRLGELEDAIENGDLVFVPECEPKYELYGNDVLGWAINKYAYEPLFEKAWYTIAVFNTKEEAEKYLEELKNANKQIY